MADVVVSLVATLAAGGQGAVSACLLVLLGLMALDRQRLLRDNRRLETRIDEITAEIHNGRIRLEHLVGDARVSLASMGGRAPGGG